jgi:CRP/FNR family transcriptional regulator, cyclic AMP receptor protein
MNMDRFHSGQEISLLSAEELVVLESIGQTLHRPAGHIFISEGEETDFALLIQKGHVKVVVGKPPRTIAIRGNGEMVGEMAAVRRKPRSASVIALNAIQVLRLPADEWLKFLYDHPRAMHAQLFAVEERLEQATRKIADSDLAVEQRLAKALIELVESDVGEPNEGGVVLRFGQQDLATLIGSSVDSVKKSVRVLRNSRVIGTGRQTTIVLDLALLRKIADGKLTVAL